MALRDQPYLPLYVKDFLTDEKLMRCSAQATGVYIRLMCVMHKSKHYGVFAIREKDKISDDILDDFARVFSSFSPFSQGLIREAFQELVDEEVIYVYRNWMCQKRMIKDAELSENRAKAGKRGMKNRYSQNDKSCYNKSDNKNVTNTEYAIEYANAYEDESVIDLEKKDSPAREKRDLQTERFNAFWSAYPKKVGKAAAVKAWVKVKPTAELFEKIMATVAAYKQSEQWQRDNGKYIPNPTTWLNQGRWDDELPVAYGRPRSAMDDLRELHEQYAREEGTE